MSSGDRFTNLSLITMFAKDGKVVCLCTVCEGRLSTDESSLALLVEAMTDHLAVNHPDRTYH